MKSEACPQNGQMDLRESVPRQHLPFDNFYNYSTKGRQKLQGQEVDFMTVFQANIRLSSDIFYFLVRDDCGEVLLTTSKGVYLQFSSGIFMLTDQSFGITPIGLGVSRFVDFVKEVSAPSCSGLPCS